MVYKNVNTILMGKSGQLKIKQYLRGKHNLHHHRSDFSNTYSTHPLHPSNSMHPLTSPPSLLGCRFQDCLNSGQTFRITVVISLLLYYTPSDVVKRFGKQRFLSALLPSLLFAA